jgi:predicted RNA binding protein YcfA (HicA-like mRNA interferase family)
MTEKKLKKLEVQIRSLKAQAGSVRSQEIVSVAQQLGRYRIRTSGHPQYGTDLRAGRITIPAHSTPLKRRTTLSILAELDTDVFYWRERISREEESEPGPSTDEAEQ